MFWGAFITCLLVSFILFFFGYKIGKKKQLSLIAGFDEKTYKGDKDKLAKTVGFFCMLIGILTILLPLGLEFVGSLTGIIYSIIVVAGTFGLIIILI